ncbi:MAG: hypothetical protein DLM68_06685 [Hyphomicrobiales bacterium]|nr:MAG: hypothetical protein DLM68_06685 [Hyphomicrobiales bacterium]
MLEIDKIRNLASAADFRLIREFVSVYTITDLESILNDIITFHSIVHRFIGLVNGLVTGKFDATCDELYKMLLNEPLVQRFLSPKDADQGIVP